jgi:dTDP-4-amino-4,6-dideoxygalactose transaminase
MMDRIPMLDLTAQHAPLADDLRAAAARVLASGRFILGPEVEALEGEIAALSGRAHGVGVSSGSDALLALLMAHAIGPGDEVITTPYSFFATTEAILRVGATPVFADVDAATMNLDPDPAAARIGPRTKAVLVVHLFGRLARTDGLRASCRSAGIPLLEDAAQAIGARGGGDGPAALSFFPSKNLGGFGDGGMVVTSDGELAARLGRLRAHGAAAPHRHEAVGGNFRLDELQAALLRVKLPYLSTWTEERQRLAAAYRDRLAGLPIELPPADDGCVWNQFVIQVPGERRAALVEHLESRGIASAIYYPVPLHLQPALAGLGHRPGDFPNAEAAARRSLALPLFPGLGPVQVERVGSALADFFR